MTSWQLRVEGLELTQGADVPSFQKIHLSKLRNLKDYGMKLEAKVFYEDADDDDDKPKWVEYVPTHLPAHTRRRFDSAAIQIFKRGDNDMVLNNVANFKTDFIKVQSPILMEELRQLLEPTEISFKKNYAEIHHPFQPLYFIWDKLRDRQAKADPETRKHLEVLLKFMDDDLGETYRNFQELKSQGRISYDLIWALFPRGTYVLSAIYGYNQAFRVLSVGKEDIGNRLYWTIRCEYVQFDGYEYGLTEATITLRHFHGTKDITSLNLVPWSCLSDGQSMKRLFIERARKALAYQNVHYLCYKGIGFLPRDQKTVAINELRFNVSLIRVVAETSFANNMKIDGRIIVDPYLYARTDESLRREVRPFRFRKQSGPCPDGHQQMANREQVEHFYFDEAREARRSAELSTLITRPRPDEHQQKVNREQVEQDEDNLWLMSPVLDGFSLNDKTWMNFLVEHVEPLKLDDSAYDDLVLEQKQKELILSFAKQQRSHVKEMSDIISGKGQGLLVLLSGPPGTGKTLTAEAVADKVGRPIYHIDTYELGVGKEGLSSRLRSIMNIAAEWDAIVLLDEADVFLQQRTPDDMVSNEHVATFLRELEYYRGTLFLTTNLLDNIDEAVESRVQVHIVYKRLDIMARTAIWENFLKRNGYYGSSVSAQDVEELSLWSLNGRQIKNVLHMATKYCSRNDESLGLESIEKTIFLTSPKAVKGNKEMSDSNSTQTNQINGSSEKSLTSREPGRLFSTSLQYMSAWCRSLL